MRYSTGSSHAASGACPAPGPTCDGFDPLAAVTSLASPALTHAEADPGCVDDSGNPFDVMNRYEAVWNNSLRFDGEGQLSPLIGTVKFTSDVCWNSVTEKGSSGGQGSGTRFAARLGGMGGADARGPVRRERPRLSLDAGLVVSPTWTPDGGRVLFSSFFGGCAWSAHQVPSTEAATPERLLAPADEIQWPCDVSPDGRWPVYAQGPMGQTDLWVAPLDGTSAPRPLLSTPFRETDAKSRLMGDGWRPISRADSRCTCAVSPRVPRRCRFRRPAQRWQRRRPGRRPARRFFIAPTALMAVTLTGPGGELQASSPRQLFTMPDQALSRSLGGSADGQRFLFVRSGGVDRLSLILNWADQERTRGRGGD